MVNIFVHRVITSSIVKFVLKPIPKEIVSDQIIAEINGH
jgi:hypothetical protein